MEAYFQYRDKDGAPTGGMVFRAPDQASLDQSIAATNGALPSGWTAEAVDAASKIVSPPPPAVSSPVIPNP